MNNSHDYTNVITRKRPRIKLYFTTQDWNVDRDADVANGLSPHICFESDRYGNTIVNKLKIRYRPDVLLNFNRLLGLSIDKNVIPTLSNSSVGNKTTTNTGNSNSSNNNNSTYSSSSSGYASSDNLSSINGGAIGNGYTYITASHIKPMDDHPITTLYNEKLNKIYKTMFPDGQEGEINKIELKDRQLFNKLLADSRTANFINANISMVTPQIYKKLKLGSDKFNNLEYIVINGKEIKTLYIAPFPQATNRQKIVHICEFCLQHHSSRFQFFRHRCKCYYRRIGKPPGDEIYRDGNISVFEIDGRENKTFCKNLCLLSMLFLKSKTLYYEVESFIFYILYRNNSEFIGYFSKEKLNNTDYNLSCILTLPTFRRTGFGFFLMEFSYLLSKREFKLGTPEKPFSDLGLITYKNFWKIITAETLIKLHDSKIKFVTLDELCNLTGMIPTDLTFGLEELQVLYYREDKNRITQEFSIFIDSWDRIEKIYHDWEIKGYQRVNPDKLLWKPMIFGPSCGVNAINTNLVDTVTDTINNDIFKKHMGLLVNFMSDDITDNKDIEIATFEKMMKLNVERLDKWYDDGNTSRWKLCYHEPIMANLTQSLINGNKVKNNRPKSNSTKNNKTDKRPKSNSKNSSYLGENIIHAKNNNELDNDNNINKEVAGGNEEQFIEDGLDELAIPDEEVNEDEEYTENIDENSEDDDESVLEEDIIEDEKLDEEDQEDVDEEDIDDELEPLSDDQDDQTEKLSNIRELP